MREDELERERQAWVAVVEARARYEHGRSAEALQAFDDALQTYHHVRADIAWRQVRDVSERKEGDVDDL